jgi:hypothetical protein
VTQIGMLIKSKMRARAAQFDAVFIWSQIVRARADRSFARGNLGHATAPRSDAWRSPRGGGLAPVGGS